jgi:hypothetical protein
VKPFSLLIKENYNSLEINDISEFIIYVGMYSLQGKLIKCLRRKESQIIRIHNNKSQTQKINSYPSCAKSHYGAQDFRKNFIQKGGNQDN